MIFPTEGSMVERFIGDLLAAPIGVPIGIGSPCTGIWLNIAG
jgi:hypothetical protein